MVKYLSPSAMGEFSQKVWDVARGIPYGKVSTYGRLAELVPPPAGVSLEDYRVFAARWVGAAMAACPEDVPWHRVINAQGKISLRKGNGPMVQHQLLEQEGVIFDEQGRVNLKKYTWQAE